MVGFFGLVRGWCFCWCGVWGILGRVWESFRRGKGGGVYIHEFVSFLLFPKLRISGIFFVKRYVIHLYSNLEYHFRVFAGRGWGGFFPPGFVNFLF